MPTRFLAIFLMTSTAWHDSRAAAAAPNFPLTIIHCNDNHANHDPQSNGDGGDARQAAVVHRIRAEAKNTLLVDAGDRFSGTLYYYKHLGLDNIPSMTKTGFQAMTLGNHEFDDGVESLAAFVEAVPFPILGANIRFDGAPRLAAKVAPFTVVEAGGQKIGVIGLTTAETAYIAKPGSGVAFDEDYAGVVHKYVDVLKTAGIDKIILLSHLGFEEDRALAATVVDVDVVVGGHSHTLLSNTYREAKHPYPVVAKDAAGKSVYIVQAGGGDNRYMGRLDVEFDQTGAIVKASGDTILLSKYITPDPVIEADLKELAKPIDEFRKRPILDRDGKPIVVPVELSNKTARDEESALGNLVADAYRRRTGARIGFIQGGGLRAGLTAGSTLTYGAVYTVLPFNNMLCRCTMKGADLLSVLENGASRYGTSTNGRFLQASGLRYTIDLAKPAGPAGIGGGRIVSVQLEEATPGGVVWKPLVLDADYTIACDSFVRGGGDEFVMFQSKGRDFI
ncbi:MAG: bifunctional metallophosphatase/5'-nucleotidase, partial [Planctomycetia bacterium]